jgi:hypothetical protein
LDYFGCNILSYSSHSGPRGSEIWCQNTDYILITSSTLLWQHCNQLRELMESVKALFQGSSRLHKFLASRERLLLEVGRMVRLGRLLRTRLREPLCPEQE